MLNEVLKGIDLLDNHPDCPDNWREMIDKDKLSMGSPELCIAGQIFGDVYAAGKVLNFSSQKDYGFNVSGIFIIENEYPFKELGKIWIEQAGL